MHTADKAGGTLTLAELAFVYEHALNWASPRGGPDARAREYAAWYVAEYGGVASLEDIPAHSAVWPRFGDRHRAEMAADIGGA